MSNSLKQSAFTWVLIVTQLAFCTLVQGRVVVCHNDGGPSHIELIRSDQSSGVAPDNCGQASFGQDGFGQGVCTGLPCVDEVISLTTTLNTRHRLAVDSLTDLIPNAPPLLVISFQSPELAELADRGTDFETACCLIELQCSIRTSVLVL